MSSDDEEEKKVLSTADEETAEEFADDEVSEDVEEVDDEEEDASESHTIESQTMEDSVTVADTTDTSRTIGTQTGNIEAEYKLLTTTIDDAPDAARRTHQNDNEEIMDDSHLYKRHVTREEDGEQEYNEYDENGIEIDKQAEFQMSERSRAPSDGWLQPSSSSFRLAQDGRDESLLCLKRSPGRQEHDQDEDGLAPLAPPPRPSDTAESGDEENEEQRPGAVEVRGRAFGQIPVWGRYRAARNPSNAQQQQRQPSLLQRVLTGSGSNSSSRDVEAPNPSVPQATQIMDASLIVDAEQVATSQDLARHEASKRRKRRMMKAGVVFVVILALAIGLGVGITVGTREGRKDGDDGSSEEEIREEVCEQLESEEIPEGLEILVDCYCERRVPEQEEPASTFYLELHDLLNMSRADDEHSCNASNQAVWWLANDLVKRNETVNATSDISFSMLTEEDECSADKSATLMQRYVLALLFVSSMPGYSALRGPKKDRNDNWLSHNASVSICDWDGVTCSFGEEQSLVFKLVRSGRGMQGELPRELEKLCGLRVLDLSNNRFNGTIPERLLLDLPHLREVNLADNRLNGSLPAVLKSNLSEEIQELHESKEDELTADTKERIKELVNISKTELEKNTLSKIDFSDNMLSGHLRFGYGFLGNLREMRIGNNRLDGIFGSFEMSLKYDRIEVISLEKNNFNGSIPTHIGKLTNLEVLELGENHITGTIVSEMGKLRKLTYLGLGLTQLNGTIPRTLEKLTLLEHLDLRSPQLQGPMPSNLCNELSLVDPSIWIDCETNFSSLRESCQCCECLTNESNTTSVR